MPNSIQKSLAIFLIITVMAPLIAFPRPAQAIVPTLSDIANFLKAGLQTIFSPMTGMSSAASTVTHDVPVSVKTFLINPIVSQLISTAIETMKNMAINQIVNGEFGAPTFVTDFKANLKDAGKNAARSFLSQLTGLNFCNFYPNPTKQTFTLSVDFNLKCKVNISDYDLYLQFPWAFSSGERLDFTHNPSTNFVFLTRNTISFKSGEIAQSVISKAAQTAQGFLGITKPTIDPRDQAKYDAAVQAEIASCEQEYIQVNIQEGKNPPTLSGDQIAICADAGSAIPQPKTTDKVVTPGAAVSDTLSKALGMDMEKTPHAKELTEAITLIVNVAFQKALSDGLKNFGL